MRHAEPELTGVLLGATDPPLSECGRAQCAALRQFTGLPTYSSPLRRAMETARAIGEPVVLPELAEIDFGDWDGLLWREIEARYPAEAAAKLEDWLGVTPPRGESWPVFRQRVLAVLPRLLQRELVVVAHSGVNAVLARK